MIYQIGNSDLAMRVEYDVSNNPIYVGEAKAGASDSALVWRIKKMAYDVSNNAISIKWAGGTSDFNKSWDGRIGYTYS